jgi:Prolyl 4-Hydroxylase alpha-subunit, N-terminal region
MTFFGDDSLISCTLVEFLKILHIEASQFPTKEDLDGVIEALLRLQDTYRLSSEQIADGELHQGIQDSSTMSGMWISNDRCIQRAAQLINSK